MEEKEFKSRGADAASGFGGGKLCFGLFNA